MTPTTRSAPRRSTPPAGCSCPTRGRACWGCWSTTRRHACASGRRSRRGFSASPGARRDCSPPAVGRSRWRCARPPRSRRAPSSRTASWLASSRCRTRPRCGRTSASGSRTMPSTACSAASSRPRATSSFARSAPTTTAAAERSLAEGMRSILDAGERIRLISGLRAFQGEQSRGALLQVIRGDPSPEVRTAALTAVGGLLDDDELLAVARRALGDPSLLVRRAAVVLFARIPPERGLPSLLRTPPRRRRSGRARERGRAGGGGVPHVRGPRPGDAARRARSRCWWPRSPATCTTPSCRGCCRSWRGAARPRCARRSRRSGATVPTWSDLAALEALTMDPVVAVRREAAGAAGGVECWRLLARMADDPDRRGAPRGGAGHRRRRPGQPRPPSRSSTRLADDPGDGGARGGLHRAPAAGHARAAAAGPRPARRRRRAPAASRTCRRCARRRAPRRAKTAGSRPRWRSRCSRTRWPIRSPTPTRSRPFATG